MIPISKANLCHQCYAAGNSKSLAPTKEGMTDFAHKMERELALEGGGREDRFGRRRAQQRGARTTSSLGASLQPFCAHIYLILQVRNVQVREKEGNCQEGCHAQCM